MLAKRIQELRRITGGSLACAWMCDEVAHLLYSLVKFYKPDTIIQTGHLWGKSACAALEGMTDDAPLECEPQAVDMNFFGYVDARRPRPKSKRFISIDPRPIEVPRPTRGVLYLQETYPVQIDYARMTSVQFFANFTGSVGRLFGIVDGDHETAGCLADLNAMESLGAECVFVDDISFIPTVRAAVDQFTAKGTYRLTLFNLYNGPGLLIKA